MMTKFLIPVVALAMSTPAAIAGTIPRPIDPLLAIPHNWQMTPDDFEGVFSQDGKKHYKWLTQDRTRAKLSRKLYRDVELGLSAFEGAVPVQEVIVDFADGRLNLVSISIFNRADSGDITAEDFQKRFTNTGRAMGQTFNVAPSRREADSRNGLLTEGYSWYFQAAGIALLEHNEGATQQSDREFLRLRVARPDAIGPLANSMSHSRGAATTRLRELSANVVRNDDGDVFIENLPMVDQGDKGYCVVATAQRVFEYYGIGADMHQIAQIAEADPEQGTNTLLMAKELDKIVYRFRTRLDIIGMGKPLTEVNKRRGEYYVGRPVDERKFLGEIRRNIDIGLPLLWSLELGRYPEKPQLSPQTSGGHMRNIIGYNDKTEEIIFSDSWGAGHEAKRMKMSHAYSASHGLFVLRPTVH